MSDFLSVIGSFVLGLFSLELPVIGISYGTAVLGLWLLYAVGKFVVSLFYGDSGGDD